MQYLHRFMCDIKHKNEGHWVFVKADCSIGLMLFWYSVNSMWVSDTTDESLSLFHLSLSLSLSISFYLSLSPTHLMTSKDTLLCVDHSQAKPQLITGIFPTLTNCVCVCVCVCAPQCLSMSKIFYLRGRSTVL